MAREVSSRESSNNKSNGAAARSSSISSKSKHGTLRLDELRARLPLSSEGRPSQLLEVVPGAHPTAACRACSGYAALSCPGLPSRFLVPSHLGPCDNNGRRKRTKLHLTRLMGPSPCPSF